MAGCGRVVLSLARVEGRRLLRHPLFLVGIALSVVMTVFAATPEGGTHSVIEPIWPAGFPIGPLAVFGFLALVVILVARPTGLLTTTARRVA